MLHGFEKCQSSNLIRRSCVLSLVGTYLDGESVLGKIVTSASVNQKLLFREYMSGPELHFDNKTILAENLCEGFFDFPFMVRF